MEFVNNFLYKLYAPFAEIDLKHAIRLVMFVGGYWFLRQAVQRYLAQRQLQNQIEQDNLQKAEAKPELYEEEEEDITSTGTEAKWGWGKQTRKRVKKQEKELQEMIENTHMGQLNDDDKDIADLLE